MKRCYICKETKPYEEFHRSSSSKDGRRKQCKECKKLLNKKERENKDKENGCTHPLKGKKPRCILNIIAATNTRKKSIEIDPILGFH